MALRDWLRLSRAEHGIITLAGVAVGWALCAPVGSRAVLAGIGPMMLTWAAFILNDYFDVASDKALKRTDRPLVSGAVNRRHALYAAAVLFGAGLGFATPFGPAAFYVALAFAIAAFAYDAYLKRLPLIGNLYIAASMAVPFIYGGVASKAPLGAPVLVLAGIAFIVGLGRELFITTRDVDGDEMLGAKTIPMVIGAKLTLKIAALLFVVAVLLSGIIYTWDFVPWPFWFIHTTLIGVCNGILLVCAWWGVNNPDAAGFKKIRNYSLAALGIGMLGFIALALKL